MSELERAVREQTAKTLRGIGYGRIESDNIADSLCLNGLQITPQAGAVCDYDHAPPRCADPECWFGPKARQPRPLCDGNHGAPICADPECWQRPSPVGPDASDLHDKIMRHFANNGCMPLDRDTTQMRALSGGLMAILSVATPSPVAPVWQAIESAPRDAVVLFYIVAKQPSECPTDTSGNPIVSSTTARIYMGKYGTWSSLQKATHWMHLPSPPDSPGATEEA